jgi:hypothetical protein
MLAAGSAGKKKMLGMELRRSGEPLLAFCGALVLGAALMPAVFAQNASTQPAYLAKPQPGHHTKAKDVQPVLPPPAPAVAPNLFDQPALPATVTTANNELTVKANNSSLAQILHQVSSKTGMQLDGLGGDERVFGSFGPGAPREVLTALLNGTSYNVVMIGDLPNGAPRELLLTHQAGGRATTPPMNQAQNANQNANQNPDQAGQNGDDAPPPDDSGNSGDDSSDDAPPMQYTPPSIAPSEAPPNANPRVTAPMQNPPQ